MTDKQFKKKLRKRLEEVNERLNEYSYNTCKTEWQAKLENDLLTHKHDLLYTLGEE